MSEPLKSVDVLWQDYAFLTREILKFSQKKEFDMILELLAQRDKLQLLIEQNPDQSFVSSPRGGELLKKLQSQNLVIENTLKRTYNNAKRTHQVSNSYDGLGQEATGSFMDRKS